MKAAIPICLMFLSRFLLAQNAPQVEDFTFSQPSLTEPSPEAFGLGKYGFLSPHKYTGAVSHSIPIYKLDFDGLKIPLTLNYNSSGHRPHEEATWVGLGWSLTSHAVITRRVFHMDDFLVDGVNNKYGWIWVLPFSFTHNPGSAGTSNWIMDPSTQSSLQNAPLGSCYKQDLENDLFSVNLFGKSLRFVMGKENGTDTVEAFPLNDQFVKIYFLLSTKSFVIEDENGFIYHFDNYLDSQNFPGGCGLKQLMSWNISFIESPYGNRAEFRYLYPHPIHIQSKESPISLHIVSYHFWGHGDAPSPPNGYNSETYSISQENYLSSIATKNQQIVFHTSNRLDLKSSNSTLPQKLDSISIRYRYTDPILGLQNVNKRSAEFETSYFRMDKINNSNKDHYLRNKLDAVIVDGKRYDFDYYGDDIKDTLPNKETFQFDYWGFYNGKHTTANLIPPVKFNSPTGVQTVPGQKREGNSNFSRLGVLKSIKYPTSGYTVFKLESNVVRFRSNHVYPWEALDPNMLNNGQYRNKKVGGIRIREINDFDSEGSLISSKTYRYEDSTSISSGLLMNEKFEYASFNELYHQYINAGGGLTEAGVRYASISSQPHTPLRSLSAGSHIGYSKVIERHHSLLYGAGYEIHYEFENKASINFRNYVKDYCTFKGGAPGYSYATTLNKNRSSRQYDHWHKNGKILETRYYDETDSIRKKVEYQYRTVVSDYYPSMSITMGGGCAHLLNRHFSLFTVYPNELKSHLLIRKKTTEYFGNNQLRTTQTRSYNDDWTINSTNTLKGDISEIDSIFYTKDYNQGVISNQAVLVQKNIKSRPIKYEKWLNGKKIKGSALRYDVFGQAKEFFDLKLSDAGIHHNHSPMVEIPPQYEREYQLSYKPNTNQVETIDPRNSMPQALIWGYGDLYPLAKATGLKRSQLNTYHYLNQNLFNSTNDKNLINNELTNLRNALTSNGFHVDTYDYNPLIGMDRRTDPSGLSKFFKYDQHGRLTSILNTNNDALTVYEYHFSNQ